MSDIKLYFLETLYSRRYYMKSREFLRFALIPRVSQNKILLPLFNPAKFLFAPSVERNLMDTGEKMHSNNEEQEANQRNYRSFFSPGIAGSVFLTGMLATTSIFANENQSESVDAEKIIKIVTQGDLNALKNYVTKENYSDIKDKKGNTLLLIAAKAGHLDIVQWLLMEEIGAIDERNNKGRTVLLKACHHGHKDLAIWLIENAGSSLKDKTGESTVLTEAVNGGNISLVQYLLGCGLDMTQIVSKSYSPIHTAAYNGDLAMVKFLINECGLDISAKDDRGGTALLYAAFGKNKAKDYEPLIQFLISQGFNIRTRDNHGCTPLLHASSRGHLFLVQYFLNNGSNVDERDKNGLTALHFAILIGDFELVRFLLSSGATVDAKDVYGKTPSDIVEEYLYESYQKILHVIIKIPKDFREIENISTLNEEDFNVIKNRENIRQELSKYFQVKLNKMNEHLFWVEQKNKYDKENDTRSVVETFRKNLSEKLNVQLYTDQAIKNGTVRTLPNTLDGILETVQLATNLSGDMLLRVAINLAKIYAQDKSEKHRKEQVSYIEIFKGKFISEITREAAKLVGERYREQLWELSAEGLDNFSQYFCDKLISGLKAKYNNSLSKVVSNMLEDVGLIDERKIIPLVRELVDVMVEPGQGKSISLELRGKDKKEKNRDKELSWNSRELMSNVGVVVKRAHLQGELIVEYPKTSKDFTECLESWKKNARLRDVLFIYEPAEHEWRAYAVRSEGKEWEEKTSDFPYRFKETLKRVTSQNVLPEVVENLKELFREEELFEDEALKLNTLYVLKPTNKKYGVSHGDKNDVLASRFNYCAFLGIFGCRPRRLSELERYDYRNEVQPERKVFAAT
jgi:ankyrin repeat protein